MENAAIVDLKRLVIRAELLIKRFERNYDEYADRLDYDHTMRCYVKDYLFSRIWNKLIKTAKYDMEELEEDFYIGKFFEGYDSRCWYRDRDGELVIEDLGSYKVMTDILETVDDYIAKELRTIDVNIGYSIFELDASRDTLKIDIYGDWRAKQWCEDNGQIYDPA